MRSDDDFPYVTSQEHVAIYRASTPIFKGILSEVRELSKKKPEATMSASKVKLVNRVLADLLIFLKGEPASKYLEELDEDALPQMSDAVLVMVQFETALHAFYNRYRRYFSDLGRHYWLTKELQRHWAEKEEGEDEGDEDRQEDGEEDE